MRLGFVILLYFFLSEVMLSKAFLAQDRTRKRWASSISVGNDALEIKLNCHETPKAVCIKENLFSYNLVYVHHVYRKSSWESLGKHVAEKHLFLKAICHKRERENWEQKSDSTEFNYLLFGGGVVFLVVTLSLNWMMLVAHVVFITELGGHYILYFLGQTVLLLCQNNFKPTSGNLAQINLSLLFRNLADCCKYWGRKAFRNETRSASLL